MKRVWIESPYAGPTEGDIARHVIYARALMEWALRQGCAPMCSHLMYTQPGVLEDHIPADRQLGIEAGFAWQQMADEIWFGTDYGFSKGMQAGLENWKRIRAGWPPGEAPTIFELRLNGSGFVKQPHGRPLDIQAEGSAEKGR